MDVFVYSKEINKLVSRYSYYVHGGIEEGPKGWTALHKRLEVLYGINLYKRRADEWFEGNEDVTLFSVITDDELETVLLALLELLEEKDVFTNDTRELLESDCPKVRNLDELKQLES